ncbi:sushi domain-containing protein, scr repeat-containing protein [Cyclospora cayetanensis]|uniref:Sushi domain-containing protein, scr repeat-containing protein n=1 Tax=Cyclospora cayetanensis TaxID=88456 RepID=A0A1D3D8G4_9EIME|nr:sushi domain-containing protein, scr repeat-containing protein [Cyclospora cayetanensis]
MLDVFCEVKDGDHCFSNAAETFDFLQRLHQTRQLQQLLQQHVCPGSRGSACFSSNIRYIAVLQELRQHMDVVMPGLQQTQQELPPLSTLGGNEAKGPEEGLLGFGVRGLLTDLRRLPAIASLLCTAVDGQSCASQVLAVGSVNPFAPLPPPEAAAGFCSSSPEAPCLLEVYRLLGKELLQPHDAETQPQKEESREQRLLRQQVHPFDWALGTTLLSIGRNFCLRSAEDQICGALLLSPDVTEPVIAAFGALVMRPYEPVAQADLPHCMCPLAFVGDGECDRSCNTAACAFDRGDCLAQQQPLLQPILESLEAATVHRADSCFPFLKGFDCSNNECKQAMRELQARHGCCLAPQLELLRDLLSIDAYQQQQQRLQLVRLQQQAPEAVTPQLLRLVDSLWNEAGSEGPPMEYYRSIAFFEGDCKMAFDRTCSRGLNRFVFSVEATLEGLDYDSLSSGIGSNTEELLRHVLRDTLSGAFGVPLGDVLLAIEVLRSDGSSGLSELLSTALQRQHAGATAAYPRQRRLQEQPLSALQKQQHVWEALVLHPVPLLLPEPLFTSAPPNVSVFEAYRLHSTLTTNNHGAVISVRHAPVPLLCLPDFALPLLCLNSAFALPLLCLPLLCLYSACLPAFTLPTFTLPLLCLYSACPYSTFALPLLCPYSTFTLPLLCLCSACFCSAFALPLLCLNSAFALPLLCLPLLCLYSACLPAFTLPTFTLPLLCLPASVECGHGYAPIEGRSPQELVCQQGRWVPLEKEANLPSSPEDLSTRILRCRKPCGAYEAFDPLVLGPAFVASGLGEADGDHRVVYCASGFVAASDTMPRTETVVCSNGTWSKRQLECVKDFAAIAETSPCAASLSRLPPTLKVESLPTTATQHGSSSATPPINSDVAAALATTFQRAGVSLQLFRIGCARGFVSTVLQQQQPLSPKQQQQPFAYAACKDGRLLDLGPEDPLPMGAFASGEAAGALAQQLKLRVDSSPEAVTAYEAVTVAGSGAPAKQAFLLDGSLGAEATNRIAAEAQQQILKGRRLQDPTPLYLGAWLGCQRELRQEPHKAPKPVSDTLLVFSSLLLLFVLVVGVLAFWWFRSHRKEKKAAKLQQQDGGDYSRQTISDLRGGLSPSELEGPPGIDVGSSAENYGGGSLQSHQFLQREGISSLAAPIFSTGLSGGPLPYLPGVPSAGHATQQVMVRRGSLPAYAEGEDRKQQQQPRTERSMSQRFKALTEEAPAVLGDSGVTSAGISLTDDEELYPEDSASCVAMTAGQRQATTTAAASSRGRPSRIPKNKGASMTHYPSSQGHGGKGRTSRSLFPSGDRMPIKHLHTQLQSVSLARHLANKVRP